MWTDGLMGIGLGLILFAGVSDTARPTRRVEFTEAIVDGRLGFNLWISESAWNTLIAQGPAVAPAHDRVPVEVDRLISTGIARRHLQCPYPMISDMGPADVGGV